jgi:hypothetical protein
MYIVLANKHQAKHNIKQPMIMRQIRLCHKYIIYKTQGFDSVFFATMLLTQLSHVEDRYMHDWMTEICFR